MNYYTNNFYSHVNTFYSRPDTFSGSESESYQEPTIPSGNRISSKKFKQRLEQAAVDTRRGLRRLRRARKWDKELENARLV